MSNDRSREGLAKFLDYLATKGLMAKGTADARKAAAGKVLGILSLEEAKDVLAIDLNETMHRFTNLQGQKYTPGSLSTYQSRVRSALDDFDKYLKNPLGFRPAVENRARTTKSQNNSNRVEKPKALDATSTTIVARPSPPANDTILPIPIRADLTIYIQGLPFDLRKNEAAKISAVITAMANSD